MFDWLFKRRAHDYSKARLQGYKEVRIDGERFVIRRINPVMDFDAGKIPQIFTGNPKAVMAAQANPDPAQLKQMFLDMYAMVEAGLVEPLLTPMKAHSDDLKREVGITVDDIFRVPSRGAKLYLEILLHSMNRMNGLKGLFFSMSVRLSLSTHLEKLTVGHLPRSSGRMAATPSSRPTASIPTSSTTDSKKKNGSGSEPSAEPRRAEVSGE